MLSHVKKSLKFAHHALVSRVVATLALTKALAKAAVLNDRIYLAFLLFCLSPFAFTLHVLFDREVEYEWMGFIENWFHLFNLIGPYLFVLVVLAGVSMLIPPNQMTYKVFKWSARTQTARMMSVPIGITIAKIIWLCSISSNEDFWAIPNWGYFAAGIFSGYIFYRIVERLVWRKFHAFDALCATLEGLYDIEMDDKERCRLARPLIQDLRHFYAKY